MLRIKNTLINKQSKNRGNTIMSEGMYAQNILIGTVVIALIIGAGIGYGTTQFTADDEHESDFLVNIINNEEVSMI